MPIRDSQLFVRKGSIAFKSREETGEETGGKTSKTDRTCEIHYHKKWKICLKSNLSKARLVQLLSRSQAGFEPTTMQIPVRYSITVLWETHGRMGQKTGRILICQGFSSNWKIQRELILKSSLYIMVHFFAALWEKFEGEWLNWEEGCERYEWMMMKFSVCLHVFLA